MKESKKIGKNILHDDIDIISFVRWMVSLRRFCLVGAGIGLAIALLLIVFKVPVSYVSRVSMLIDPTSLPAIFETEKIVRGVNAALLTPEYSVDSFKELAEAFKASGENAEEGKLIATLMNRHGGESLIGLPIRMLDMTQSADSYMVELRLPFKGLGAKTPEVALKMLNTAIKAHNTDALNRGLLSAKTLQDEALAYYKVYENDFASKQTERIDALKAQLELNRLESRILGKALSANIDAKKISFWMQNPVSDASVRSRLEVKSEDIFKAYASLAFGNDLYPSIDFSRVFRLMAFLQEERKISDADMKTLLDEALVLRERFFKTRNFAVADMQAKNAAIETIMDAAKLKSQPVKREEKYLPLFQVSGQLSKINAAMGVFEKAESIRKILLVAMVFIGAIVGLTIGALRDIFYSRTESNHA